jgi:hypothetical protein
VPPADATLEVNEVSMRFQLADDVFQPDVTKIDRFASRSTGREQRRISIRFRTGETGARKRIDSFQTGAVLTGIDDAPPSRWRKIGTSSSMNDGRSSNWVHLWEIEEMENLMPSVLIINDLRLSPERYAERWDGERLDLHALVSLNAAEHSALKRMIAADDGVFVTRSGISEEVRTMEIQRGPWSEHEGSFRWLIRLQDPPEESERRPSAGFLEMGRTHHSVPYLLALVEEMGNLLVTKGVLSEAEQKSLKDRAIERRGERAVEMLKVDDVAAFWESDIT